VTILAREAMSNSQVLGMVGYLLFYASVGLGALVGICLVVKHLSAYLKVRYGDPRQAPVVERIADYTVDRKPAA
jgi:hypothetical protein